MRASLFVGRVGGLAVALGVGAAVFSGPGVAWADRSAPDTRGSAGSAADSDSTSQSSAPARGRGAAAGRTPSATASTAVAQQTRNSRPAAPSGDEPISVPAPAPATAEATPAPPAASVVTPDPDPVKRVADPAPEPVVENIAGPVVEAVEPVVVADLAPKAAPAGEVVAYGTAASGGQSGGAGSDPSAPVGHPLVDLLLASFIRRETVGAAATGSPTAQVTASTGLTVAPVTTYFDGVLQGNLNVTSASGCGLVGSDCKLVYSFVGSSAGGKATLDKVPASLPGGGAGSYTFLPYATWIDPDNPTRFPTATGTQDFTVRVSENTAFDQFLVKIPLVGLLAQPIINLLQQTPFLGDLLAPIIGASATQTVSVNVGSLVTAGKQVAYTYFVDSFDGTPISMNYFPASAPSLLPALGNQQATIFNGPGLGSPGETNPYGFFQAAGSVPGVGLMRGQGLPAQFATAPLGFNVITWDPRGEWASGGILQLDNPFYEGRDVSALIDWADANTPLLNENGDPDVAMMGGSYGGGIQMTTVDPRIDAIVPAIAWNSLNESLYPDAVFKTAWANALALALLGSGASSLDRVNSQITQALLTGNLFGFISETAQAVLSSSGPTALLTKLSIPTMYAQGTADALFPLQQALNNAQTQLDLDPFFAGANADLVKMIWFCGGHGVCTTQTTQQQTAQATVMFLENMIWVNNYTKDYLQGIPTIKPVLDAFLGLTAPFQWWDQNGTALASFDGMPWTSDFQDTPPITVTDAVGGRLGFLQMAIGGSGPNTTECTVAQACEFPLSQVFATEAKNAINVDIPIPPTVNVKNPSVVVGAPTVSFTYSGVGNAKAVYAQVVDNATGQVLGNIVTPIPVTLDGKTHTIDAFPIANIAYTAPGTASTLTLQIVGNATLYANGRFGSVNISDITVELPTTGTAVPNPIPGLL